METNVTQGPNQNQPTSHSRIRKKNSGCNNNKNLSDDSHIRKQFVPSKKNEQTGIKIALIIRTTLYLYIYP